MEHGIFWRGRFWRIAGGNEGEGENTPPNTGDGTGQPSGNAPQQNAGGTNGDKRFTQAELDAIVADRLKRATEAADRKSARERQEAEERAAAEQGEFKKLAEQRQARVAELEPFEGQAKRYEAALTKLLEVQRKDLPGHITALLDKLDPADQLEWIATNQDALKPTIANGSAGPNPTPRNSGPPSRQQMEEDLYQRMKAGAFPRL